MEDVREDRLEVVQQDPSGRAAPPSASAGGLAPAGSAEPPEVRRHPWLLDFELPEVLRSGRMPGRWADGDED
jgi:hypothetical protein